MRNSKLASCFLFFIVALTIHSAEVIETDICVYGGTSAGMAAAVQAARMGKGVIIVSPDKHLGGLSAGGLGWTDSGNKAVIGGLAREFYHGIWKHYQDEAAWKWQKRAAFANKGQGTPAMDGEQRTMWIFEPHVAEKVFETWVAEHKIRVMRDAWLDRAKGVKKNGARIVSITTLDGRTFAAKMFIDATYEGDLMAAAGVSYHVGREANAQYGETLNGVQTQRAHSHQFDNPIDPYVKPGDPSSGLLPRIHAGQPGEEGSGDKRIQAYNFRMCLTNAPENRVPFPKPDGYDPKQYELLLRTLQAGSRHVFGKFDPIPNAKTDTNNHGSFSTDNIGMNYDYPEASYERRREIIAEHRTYQQGYLYFLCNDPRVPEDVRQKMSLWGLAKDEFLDNGNWPHQIYVREARRMVSDYVHTELDCRRTRVTPESVGMGSYNMDSHNVQRYVDKNGHARNEGDIQVGPGGPYMISYRSLVPKQNECENLLVPVCVSCSHIAYGSIRMEPVFMILAQSAATAAVFAIDEKIPVQKVSYEKLSARLLADKQVLEHATAASAKSSPPRLDPTKLAGIVLDDAQATKTGEWRASTTIEPFIGDSYLTDNNTDKGKKSIRYTPKLPNAGRYEIRVFYTALDNRSSNTPIVIHTADGEKTIKVNQRQMPKDAAFSLGVFDLTTDAWVELRTDATDGHVIADAVQFLPAK